MNEQQPSWKWRLLWPRADEETLPASRTDGYTPFPPAQTHNSSTHHRRAIVSNTELARLSPHSPMHNFPARLPLKIISSGTALPAQRVSSVELDRQFSYPNGTVFRRCGIIERRFAPPSVLQSELAAAAVTDALANGGLSSQSIDLLLSVSGVPQQALPSTAAAIAGHLSLPPGTLAFDVNSSCLGFMAGLHVAAGLLSSGLYQRIAVVASDLASRGVDWSEPEASLIFGDGAAAVIVEKGSGRQGFHSFFMETHPEGFAHCEIRAGGTRRNPREGVDAKDFLFRMDGRSVFKLASRVMPPLLDKALTAAGVKLEDIDVIVPHQASHLGMAHLTKRLNLCEDKLVNIYPTHGNQVSASMPTALHHAFETGLAAPGKRLLMLGTAAGFTAGAAVLEL